MWVNIIFVAIVFVIAFAGFTGYTLAKDNGTSKSDQVSKAEYTDKLAQLSPDNIDKNNAPNISAMCYEMAAPPSRIEYRCPICGEVTLYSLSSINEPIEHILYYRGFVTKITKFDVKLDESQLCEKCSPKTYKRKLCLIVKADKTSKPHKTCGVSGEDIKLLYEYSKGLEVHNIPLIKDKARLEELLDKPIKDIK